MTKTIEDTGTLCDMFAAAAAAHADEPALRTARGTARRNWRESPTECPRDLHAIDTWHTGAP